MKKRCFRPYNYPLFHKLKTKRKMNEEEFVKFLGYEKFALKKIENTDEKILEFFEESLIEGKVYIPWSEQWIREYSCRQKMSIEEFVKFLDDNATYLGNQLECEFGGNRCFGIVCNMDFILICTYEENGENPELVIYKKR